MNQRNQLRVNSIKFYNTFSTDEDYYRYLSEIKWDTGYQCKKCSQTKYHNGVIPFSRRYMKCKYDESPTAGTMFDKCKFPLLLAFHIAFRIRMERIFTFKKVYPNLSQIKSENGKSFQDIHIHIMNLKGCLRGIHHCSFIINILTRAV